MSQETNANQPNGNAAPNAAEPKAAEAKPGLNQLLQQFETSAAPKATAIDVLKAFQPTIEWVDQQRIAQQTQAVQNDVSSSVKSVKESLKLGDEFPDDLVRGYLYDHANQDKDFAAAWDNRSESPDAWKSQLGKATESFKSIVGKLPGNSVRTDLEAATAAVRNVSTAPQPAPSEAEYVRQLRRMSDRELEAHMRELAAQQR